MDKKLEPVEGKRKELFIVERIEDGEWIDSYGNGGYSVYSDRGEAQDALDTEADSGRESDHYKVVRFLRESASTPLPVDLPAEILELRDALRQSERDALIELWDAAKIMCESLPIYSTSSSAFQRKQRLDAALGRVTQILGACV